MAAVAQAAQDRSHHHVIQGIIVYHKDERAVGGAWRTLRLALPGDALSGERFRALCVCFRGHGHTWQKVGYPRTRAATSDSRVCAPIVERRACK